MVAERQMTKSGSPVQTKIIACELNMIIAASYCGSGPVPIACLRRQSGPLCERPRAGMTLQRKRAIL
ncbi:hypothetical protein SAMN02927924_00953 [Sphingobium faniae]|nr:hypothetical protein SAMN02927924_00953 [Sphingobium faniae]